MKSIFVIIPLAAILLSGCSTTRSLNYDKLSYHEFSSLVFSNETYLAMQQPCKRFNLREQVEQAVACQESVARQHPDSPEAQYLLAIAYLNAGDAGKTKQQALIIEQQSEQFLRLTFHAVARTNRTFIRAFKFEPRWLKKS